LSEFRRVLLGQFERGCRDELIHGRIGKEDVRRALAGKDLSQLRETVTKEFLALDETEQSVRAVMAKLETGFLRRFATFRHE